MTARLITFLVLFVAMAAIWAAVMVTYHVTSRGRWWNSPTGRHLMTTAGCFTWSAALTVVNIWAGQYPLRFWVQVISYGAFVVIGAQRLILMALQRKHERDQGPSEQPSASPPSRPETPHR